MLVKQDTLRLSHSPVYTLGPLDGDSLTQPWSSFYPLALGLGFSDSATVQFLPSGPCDFL